MWVSTKHTLGLHCKGFLFCLFFLFQKKVYFLFIGQLCMKCTWTVSWRKPFGFRWVCFSRDYSVIFVDSPLALCCQESGGVLFSCSPMSRRPHVTSNSHDLVEHFQTKGSSYPAGTDGSPTPNLSEKTKEDSNRKGEKKSTATWILPHPPSASSPPGPSGVVTDACSKCAFVVLGGKHHVFNELLLYPWFYYYYFFEGLKFLRTIWKKLTRKWVRVRS